MTSKGKPLYVQYRGVVLKLRAKPAKTDNLDGGGCRGCAFDVLESCAEVLKQIPPEMRCVNADCVYKVRGLRDAEDMG